MKRFIQRITGFNYVHHIQYSFGYIIPFTGYGFFYGFWKQGLINSPFQKVKLNRCHNCTKSGVY